MVKISETGQALISKLFTPFLLYDFYPEIINNVTRMCMYDVTIVLIISMKQCSCLLCIPSIYFFQIKIAYSSSKVPKKSISHKFRKFTGFFKVTLSTCKLLEKYLGLYMLINSVRECPYKWLCCTTSDNQRSQNILQSNINCIFWNKHYSNKPQNYEFPISGGFKT